VQERSDVQERSQTAFEEERLKPEGCATVFERDQLEEETCESRDF
jgi:hypothetical protein